MEYNDDYALALSLSLQFNDVPEQQRKKQMTNSCSRSIVDPELELLDPNPNIHQLFIDFNKTFFWGKLDMVEVKWSPRMTLCAGICSYQGRGGLCSIRLSKPLLMLRTRKDLVETLLHEMIHAFLFVTDNNTDHDGHGPQFCSHMKRINDKTGTNITIYHSFHDEVNEMRKHWWRCTGACRSRPPYFGFVKRAMNRKPSPKDFWWSTHQASCHGHFEKVKEPENYGKKVKTKKVEAAAASQTSTSSQSMLKFLTQTNNDKGISSVPTNGEKDVSNTLDWEKKRSLKNHDSKMASSRGIPLSSKIFDKFRKARPDPIPPTSTGKLQGRKDELSAVCRNARLTGEKSVNDGASAFGKFGVITKFLTRKEQRQRVAFSSDEERDGITKSRPKADNSTPAHQQKVISTESEFTKHGIKRKSEDNTDYATQVKRKPVSSFWDTCKESGGPNRDDPSTSSANKPQASEGQKPKAGNNRTTFPVFSTKSNTGKSPTGGDYSLLICDSDDNDTSSDEDDLTLLGVISPKMSDNKRETLSDMPALPKTCNCPICDQLVPTERINSHIDLCLNQGALDQVT